MPSKPLPNRLVTQTLPWLSMPRPLLLNPTLKFSTLLGSAAGKARDVVDAAIRYPDPVLLVDAEMKWRLERFARLRAVAFADDAALADIAFGEVDELALLDAQRPDIAARRDDDTLHQPEPAAEGDAFRRRQRLAVLVEYRDGLAAIGGEPGIVLGIHRGAEGAALHPAAGEACGDRRKRLAVGGEFGGVALP